jgi:hypothetical protein
VRGSKVRGRRRIVASSEGCLRRDNADTQKIGELRQIDQPLVVDSLITLTFDRRRHGVPD